MTRSADRDGILKVGPQYYRVFIELPQRADGMRRRESHTVKGTLEQAKAVRAQLLADQSRGLYVGRSGQRLDAYLQSWLDYKRGTVADRTWERYDSLCRLSIIPALGHVRLSDLSPQHLTDYYAACRVEPSRKRPGKMLSGTTINHRHTVLKTALRYAVRIGLIARNPADLVDAPKRDTTELEIMDEVAAYRLLIAFESTDIGMLVWLALNTGARLGEILALRWADIDLNRQVVHINRTVVEHMRKVESDTRRWFDFKEPKSGKGRAIEIDAETIRRLRSHKREQTEQRLHFGTTWVDYDLVFPNTSALRAVEPGEPIRPSTISRTFRHRVEGLGLPGINFHALRHAHATMLLRQGFAPHLVSRRLGHSDVAITLRVYAGVLPGQEKAMVDAFAAALLAAGDAH
jgi:integrase